MLEQQGMFPEDWTRIYSAEILLALEHVHSQHIIFRDLKPENVMVGMDGHLKLTDFGMSKRLEVARMAVASKAAAGEEPGGEEEEHAGANDQGSSGSGGGGD